MRGNQAAAAISLALAAAAATAPAADLQFDPYIELGGLYNDNYTLDVVRPRIIEVSGAFAEAGLQLRAASPRSQWTFEPRIRKLEFPDDEQFESTDYFLDIGGQIVNERSAFGFTAEFFDQNIVFSQLPDSDFGDADLGQGTGTDSGRIVSDDRQTNISARPFVQFDLSELTRLRLEGALRDVSFDRDVLGAQVSYQSIGGSIRLDRRFSEASTVGLIADMEEVDPEIGPGNAELYSVQLQWDYRLAERLSAYGRAGVRRSKFDVPGVTPQSASSIEEDTPLFGAGIRWNFLRSEVFVDLQRTVSGNSSGFVVERDDLRVFYNHRFSARVRGYLGLYAIRDESVTATGFFTPREYVAGSAGFEWRFQQAWSLLGEFGHSRQQFDGLGSADGTSVRASVVFRPRRRD